MDLNLRAPGLGPQFAIYPELPQVVRLTSPPVATSPVRVYPGIVQQYAGSLAFRDREACYLVEPNNVLLGPGYYDARLVGNYLGLPLYAATCCVTGSLSSQSSISSGSSPAASSVTPASSLLSSSSSPAASSQASSSSRASSSSSASNCIPSDALGQTVNVSAYFPNLASLFDDPGDAVVSGGVEYPVGSYAVYNPTFEVDIQATRLIFTNTGPDTTFASSTFNGLVMVILSGRRFVTASADPSSGFSPISVAIAGGTALQLNYSGVASLSGTSSIINFTICTPVS